MLNKKRFEMITKSLDEVNKENSALRESNRELKGMVRDLKAELAETKGLSLKNRKLGDQLKRSEFKVLQYKRKLENARKIIRRSLRAVQDNIES